MNISINKYILSFKSNIFLQNIALVASGNVIAKLIGIISIPIITRIYSPEEFGIYAVFTSVIGIIGSFSTLRYHIAIPLASDEYLSDNLNRLSFIVSLFLGFITALFILFFGNNLVSTLSISQIKPYLWLIPLAFIGQGFYQILSNWTIRKKYYKLITRTKISQNFSAAGIKIGLGALGLKPIGLLLGIIALEATGIYSITAKLFKEKPDFLRIFSWRKLLDAAVRYKNFPLLQTWSHLLLNLGIQLPVIFMATIFGSIVAGVFGLAQNIINIPLILLVNSVSEVYYGEIAKYGKSNTLKIYHLTIRIMKRFATISLIPLFIIIFFGPMLVKFTFGPEWLEAGIFIRYLTIIIFTQIIASPITNVFYVLEKQSLDLKFNIIRVVFILSVFGLSKFLDITAVNTILIYSITSVQLIFLTINT